MPGSGSLTLLNPRKLFLVSLTQRRSLINKTLLVKLFGKILLSNLLKRLSSMFCFRGETTSVSSYLLVKCYESRRATSHLVPVQENMMWFGLDLTWISHFSSVCTDAVFVCCCMWRVRVKVHSKEKDPKSEGWSKQTISSRSHYFFPHQRKNGRRLLQEGRVMKSSETQL